VTDPLVKDGLVAATVFPPPSTGLKLREFVQRVESVAELKEIRGAYWDLEIGALTEVSASLADLKPLLFDEIIGYPKGYRVLGAILSTNK
jgi:3-polyprenyl-4-hydroxybenzoate decarboxylase